jgi:predicted 3-demethylubiquinone-9 3-methyltransferase (glyoxalase superfamily)
LWFDSEAERAAKFYVGIFANSRIVSVSRYDKAGFKTHHRPPGTVMTVLLELDGQLFTAFNGGPISRFNDAVSLQVNCETQDEIDYYWRRLSRGGDPCAQVSGRLRDKYGLSWQVIPTITRELLRDESSIKSRRAMEAMMQMRKLDIAELCRAYDG